MLGGIFAPREGADPTEIAVTVTTPNLFDLLGVAPMLGRSFTAAEAGPGRPNLIVLTHGLWNRIGADPGLDRPRRAPAGQRLHGDRRAAARLLVRASSKRRGVAQRIDAYIANHDATRRHAGHEGRPLGADACAPRSHARRGGGGGHRRRAAPSTRATSTAAGCRSTRSACTTISWRVLVRRWSARRRRRAPALMLTVEPGVGAPGARGAARARGRGLARPWCQQRGGRCARPCSRAACSGSPAGPRVPRRDLGDASPRGAGAARSAAARRDRGGLADRRAHVALGVGLGLLAGAAPAVWAARATLSSLLASSAVRGGGGHGRMRRGDGRGAGGDHARAARLRRAGRAQLRALLRSNPGFDADGVLTIRVRSPPEFFPNAADIVAFQDRVERELSAIPGVTGVSATTALPLLGAGACVPLTDPGAPGNTGIGRTGHRPRRA